MIIDTHCHIDMYKNPLDIAKESEIRGIITIGMTNLPSHFEMGQPYLQNFKKVRLALGLHPLYAEHHKKELAKFIQNISNTSYIGEIGLDFSREGISTKTIQLESFKYILEQLKEGKKILSLHSRKAEREVLEHLIEYNIQSAIFHWYSGSLTLIDEIVRAGYYFSINPSMIKSKSGQAIINRIPIENILTESDGPFIETDGRPIKPIDIMQVIDYLSVKYNLTIDETEKK